MLLLYRYLAAASGRPHSSQGGPSVVHGDGSSSTNNREADRKLR